MIYTKQIRKICLNALKILYYMKFLMRPNQTLIKRSADEVLKSLSGEFVNTSANNQIKQIEQKINGLQSCIELFKQISINVGNILGCDRYTIIFPEDLINDPDNDIYLLQAFFESYFLPNDVDKNYYGHSQEALFCLVEYLRYVKSLINHNKINYVHWTTNQMKDIHQQLYKYQVANNFTYPIINIEDVHKFQEFRCQNIKRWQQLNQYWNIYIEFLDIRYVFKKQFDVYLPKDYQINSTLMYRRYENNEYYTCHVWIEYLLKLSYTVNIKTNLCKCINIRFPDEIRDKIYSTKLSYNIDLLSSIKKQIESDPVLRKNQANLWEYFQS